jgi:hypothetical protein
MSLLNFQRDAHRTHDLRAPESRDRRRNRTRLGVESLEGRSLLSTMTSMSASALIGGVPIGPLSRGPITDPQGASVPLAYAYYGDSPTTSTSIEPNELAPMEDTRIDGTLPASNNTGKFTAYLQAGQTIEASADLEYDYGFTANVILYQTDNHSATISVKADPVNNALGTNNVLASDTILNSSQANDGPVSSEASFVYTAPINGWYDFSVSSPVAEPSLSGCTSEGIAYAATLRPIGLDHTPDTSLDPNHVAADASKLDFTGGSLDAWFSSTQSVANNPTSGLPSTDGTTATSGYLTFSGPTGRGFQILSNWSERQGSNGSETYTSSGTITLESALGAIALPMASGTSLAVTTSDLDGNGVFGQVTSTKVSIVGLPISEFTDQLNSDFNFNISGLSSDLGSASWGIALGGTVATQTGAPTNPAVPYLYFAANAPVGVSYGGFTASASSGGAGLNVAIDPADPMIYLDIKGLPAVSDLGFAGSLNDLMPYLPEYTPNSWTGQFYGDVYFRGTLDLGDLTDEAVPVSLSGDMTLNLDPHHQGLGTSAKQDASDFANAVESPNSTTIATLGEDLASISIGIDGTASLGIDKGILDFSIPLGGASLIWDGQTETAYLHSTANSLANGLPGLLNVTDSVTIDASYDVQSKAFELELASDFQVLGTTMAGSVEVDNSGVTFEASLSFDTGWMGTSYLATGAEATGSVDVTIAFATDGDVTFGLSSSLGVSYEVFGGSHSWTDQFSFSETVDVAALGTSLWDDIKGAIKNDVFDKLDI